MQTHDEVIKRKIRMLIISMSKRLWNRILRKGIRNSQWIEINYFTKFSLKLFQFWFGALFYVAADDCCRYYQAQPHAPLGLGRRDSSWPFWSIVNRKGWRFPFPRRASPQDNEQVLRRQRSRLGRKVCSLSSISLARSLDVPRTDGRSNTDEVGVLSFCVYQTTATNPIALAPGFSDQYYKRKNLDRY